MAIIDLINRIFAGRFWVPVDNRSLTLPEKTKLVQLSINKPFTRGISTVALWYVSNKIECEKLETTVHQL